MYEWIHKAQGVGDHDTYKYADIYVKDRAEAVKVSTNNLAQGSKLYIVEAAELFVLNEDEGVWCSAVNGAALTEV